MEEVRVERVNRKGNKRGIREEYKTTDPVKLAFQRMNRAKKRGRKLESDLRANQVEIEETTAAWIEAKRVKREGVSEPVGESAFDRLRRELLATSDEE